MRGLILALLSCRAPAEGEAVKPYTSPDVPDWTSYTGTFTYTLAGTGADEPGCSLVYQFEGSPADITCDDCEYSFKIEMFYDEESSVNTWSCLDDEDEADFTWTLGFDADFYGYDIGAMWKYSDLGAYWYQAFYAEWDGDTLNFGYEFTYPAYYYDYYEYSFYGTGAVRE